MEIFVDTLNGLVQSSGFMGLSIQSVIMILLSFVLFYLAIVKQYEPLLMLPIAFGMLLTNLPMTGLYHAELWDPATNPYFAPEYIEQAGGATYVTVPSVGAWNGGYLSGAETVSRLQH